MVVAGSVLLLLVLLGGVLGSSLAIRTIDPVRFQRDVVVDGAASRPVPGNLTFKVVPSIRSSRDDVMTVGVYTTGTGVLPVCTVTTGDGATVDLRQPQGGEVFVRDPGGGAEIVATARLGSGTYTVACEPGGRTDRRFAVGRVFSVDDVRELGGPLLWFFALILLVGAGFLTGTVLLVLGLVRRSRYRRSIGELPPVG